MAGRRNTLAGLREVGDTHGERAALPAIVEDSLLYIHVFIVTRWKTRSSSRASSSANIGFHILFPTITIALGWILLFVFRLRDERGSTPIASGSRCSR